MGEGEGLVSLVAKLCQARLEGIGILDPLEAGRRFDDREVDCGSAQVRELRQSCNCQWGRQYLEMEKSSRTETQMMDQRPT